MDYAIFVFDPKTSPRDRVAFLDWCVEVKSRRGPRDFTAPVGMTGNLPRFFDGLCTPLHVSLLLQAGADPERKCTLGWTALDHAINEDSAAARELLLAVTKTPARVRAPDGTAPPPA